MLLLILPDCCWRDQPHARVVRIDAAWNGLLERNVILEDTEEGYTAQIGDSVSVGTSHPRIFPSALPNLSTNLELMRPCSVSVT